MMASYDTIIDMPSPIDKPTRAQVLTTAHELLTEHGVEALSMRRLAAALGTSYQVVYSRVGGKPELVRELHRVGFAHLTRRATQITAAPGTEDHLVALAHGYLDAAIAEPVMFDIMFGNPISEFVRDAEATAVERAGFEATWVDACRAWLDARVEERPRGAALRLAWRLWTAVHGITVLHLAGHPSPFGDTHDGVADTVRRLLVDPLSTR